MERQSSFTKTYLASLRVAEQEANTKKTQYEKLKAEYERCGVENRHLETFKISGSL